MHVLQTCTYCSHARCDERQHPGDHKDALGQHLDGGHLEQAVLVGLVADAVVVPHKVADGAHVVVQQGVGDGELEGEEQDGVRRGDRGDGALQVAGEGEVPRADEACR